MEAHAAGGQAFGDAQAATRTPPSAFSQHAVSEQDQLLELIGGMPAGARFGLERVRPEFAKGWLGTVELPEGASIDYVLEAIREMWGGGTFRIKPLTRSGQWAPGAVTVNIAGAPLWRTMPYRRDGSIDDGTRPPLDQQWYSQPPPAARMAQPVAAPPPADNPQIVTALSGLVQSLAGNQTAEVRAKLEEVTAALRTAPQVAPPPPVDGFGEIRKSLELLRSLKDIAGDLFDGGGGDDAPAPAQQPIDPQMMQMMQMMQGGAPGAPGAMGGMPFGAMPFAMPKKSEDLMLMLAMQWMGRNQQQPQGGQWVQGPNGAPVYVVPVQTPQGVQWMATQPPAPQQPPPQQWTQPPPQQWAPPQQQQQPAAPPPQQRPASGIDEQYRQQTQHPVVDVSAHTARPEEPEQLTPRDVLEQLERMDPDQAARFFDEVGSNLPPHVQGALVAMMQRMQQQPPPPPPQQPPQRVDNVVGMSPFALSYEHDK